MLMLCCSMIGVCGKYLYDYFAQSTENKNAYADIIDIDFSDSTDNQYEDDPENETEQEMEASDFNYDSLLAINSDCVGWTARVLSGHHPMRIIGCQRYWETWSETRKITHC